MPDRWRIIESDALEALRALPDASFDAALLDPPYGLGPREPSVEELVAYLTGAELDTGGDFMGKAWKIPSVAVWRELLRVLKRRTHRNLDTNIEILIAAAVTSAGTRT